MYYLIEQSNRCIVFRQILNMLHTYFRWPNNLRQPFLPLDNERSSLMFLVICPAPRLISIHITPCAFSAFAIGRMALDTTLPQHCGHYTYDSPLTDCQTPIFMAAFYALV